MTGDWALPRDGSRIVMRESSAGGIGTSGGRDHVKRPAPRLLLVALSALHSGQSGRGSDSGDRGRVAKKFMRSVIRSPLPALPAVLPPRCTPCSSLPSKRRIRSGAGQQVTPPTSDTSSSNESGFRYERVPDAARRARVGSASLSRSRTIVGPPCDAVYSTVDRSGWDRPSDDESVGGGAAAATDDEPRSTDCLVLPLILVR